MHGQSQRRKKKREREREREREERTWKRLLSTCLLRIAIVSGLWWYALCDCDIPYGWLVSLLVSCICMQRDVFAFPPIPHLSPNLCNKLLKGKKGKKAKRSGDERVVCYRKRFRLCDEREFYDDQIFARLQIKPTCASKKKKKKKKEKERKKKVRNEIVFEASYVLT